MLLLLLLDGKVQLTPQFISQKTRKSHCLDFVLSSHQIILLVVLILEDTIMGSKSCADWMGSLILSTQG